MPVRGADVVAADDGRGFRRALRSIVEQTAPPGQIVVILDGRSSEAPAVTRDAFHALDGPARGIRLDVLDQPRRNISEGLNRAMRDATAAPLVARMDADDLSHPPRLARQAERMRNTPELVALGTWADRLDADGAVVETLRPPLEPARLRWRVLLENPLVHGSVMLRREAVLDAGGYDERLDRAQDYELWLRLAARDGAALGNLGETLYSYTTPTHGGIRSPEQARAAAQSMIRHWASLRPDTPDDDAAVESLLLAHLAGEPAALDDAECTLDDRGPTQRLLSAYLFLRTGPTGSGPGIVGPPEHVLATAQRARLREVLRSLAAQGVREAWLYGTGRHSQRLLSSPDAILEAGGVRFGEFGTADCAESGPRPSGAAVLIRGILDDRPAAREGPRGLRVVPPSGAPDGAVVVLSSDWREDQLWRASEPLRRRGCRVVRLYPPDADRRE